MYTDEGNILKAGKQGGNFQGKPLRPAGIFSTETLQVRREWHDIFNVVNGKNL